MNVQVEAIRTASSPTLRARQTVSYRAQRNLRELASGMLAFAGREKAACIALKPFGFDPAAAGSGMIGLANLLDRHGADRTALRSQVEKTLRFARPPAA